MSLSSIAETKRSSQNQQMFGQKHFLKVLKNEINVLAKRFRATDIDEIPDEVLTPAMKFLKDQQFQLDDDVVSFFDGLSFSEISESLEKMEMGDQHLVFGKVTDDLSKSFVKLKKFIENNTVNKKDAEAFLSLLVDWFDKKDIKTLIVVGDVITDVGYFVDAWLNFAGRFAEIEHPSAPTPFRQCAFGRVFFFNVDDWKGHENECFRNIVNGISTSIITDFNIQRRSCEAPVIGMASTLRVAYEFKNNISEDCEIILLKGNFRDELVQCHPLAIPHLMNHFKLETMQ